MPEQIPQVKVFLSSPGDVPEERQAALEVLEWLPNCSSFRDKVSFRVVAWDKPGAGTPMLASKSPQEAINERMLKPCQCEIVVVILWSRMGTPFSYNGVDYLSGTHYELLDALNNPQTDTLIYLRTEEKLFKASDAEGIAQYNKVQAFFKSELFYDPVKGQIRRGVNKYASPADFKKKFENDLEIIVKLLLERKLTQSVPIVSAPLEPEVQIIATKKWEGSPFPGLRSFKRADAPIFFGREAETDALVRKVAESRFVAVVGASGSGKSSLVGAGLLPRLETNAIPGSKDWWVVQFTPGKKPFEALFEGINKSFAPLPKDKQVFMEEITRNPATLGTLLNTALESAKAPEWAEVLLFIDQFEELFTLAQKADVEPFTRMLSALAEQPRMRVVVTIRHDFVPRAIEISELAKLLRQGFFPMSAPSPGALLQMIERPAEMAALKFDEGLSGEILHDTGSEAGSLALLAYLLDELYKVAVEKRKDNRLTYADYEALGKVEGAIGKRAEQVFEKLPGEEAAKTRLLGQVFRELVTVEEVKGQFAATRQRVRHDCFGVEELALVEAFTEARLLVKGEEQVEVAHEALFRSWGRLRLWIEEYQDDLILRRQVQNGAEDWARQGKPEAWRWSQERLLLVYGMQERLKWKPSEQEEAFIEPEQERLLRETNLLRTSHLRRDEIGRRLSVIGDTRRGIGTSEIAWLPVYPGGEVAIEKESFKVAPFYIGQYQITYEQYEEFVKAADGYEQMEWWAGFPKEYQKQELVEQNQKGMYNPRDSISWYQAVAYGRWLNKRLRGLELGYLGNPQGKPFVVGGNAEIRLPTEWEWQWAAQGGTEARKYPWGDWKEGYANTNEASLGHPVGVGLYPHGAARFGALDMSGNVREWCLNKYRKPEEVGVDESKDTRVLRGGSYYGYQVYASCAYRYDDLPRGSSSDYGFRVVLSSLMRHSAL